MFKVIFALTAVFLISGCGKSERAPEDKKPNSAPKEALAPTPTGEAGKIQGFDNVAHGQWISCENLQESSEKSTLDFNQVGSGEWMQTVFAEQNCTGSVVSENKSAFKYTVSDINSTKSSEMESDTFIMNLIFENPVPETMETEVHTLGNELSMNIKKDSVLDRTEEFGAGSKSIKFLKASPINDK